VNELVQPSFAFGRFRYDGVHSKLLLDGREIPLPPRELHLLTIFLHHPDEWLAEEWISRGLWPKAVPPSGELDRLVRELAAALEMGADGVATIQSAPGRGYRLLIPVRPLELGGARGAPAVAGPAGAASAAGIGRAAPRSGPAAGAAVSGAGLAERRSAHRTLLSPRRLALGVIAVFALGAALFWAVRSYTHRTGGALQEEVTESNPEALRAAAGVELAKGVAAARRVELSSRRAAIGRFESALALDPSFAPARAALAGLLALEGDLERARREVQTTLALDPDLAEAHAARSFVQLFHDRDPAAARVSAERALELDASSVLARRSLAWANAVEGKFVAALADLSVALPRGVFDPELATDEGTILYLSGRLLEARRQLSEVVRVEPAFRRAHAALAALHLYERRLGAAAFELELCDALATGATRDDERVRQGTEGVWSLQDAAEAARLLEARAESIYLLGAAGAQLEAARIFAQFGEQNRALASLTRALERRETTAVLARVDPVFAAMREMPAFRELLDRSGVPALAPEAASPRR
jgi:DNA-binding winged helix-turn-helix (wHTH) protein/tetratricopeptide (TPR) repeat protein